QQGIADHEQGKPGVLEEVEPRRALHAAYQAGGREHAWKYQDPGDHGERREEITARDHEVGMRAQDRKLAEQEDCGDRIANEHRHRIGRDKRVDRAQSYAGKRTRGNQDEYRQDAEDDGKSEPLLRRTWRQVRENELFLWD